LAEGIEDLQKRLLVLEQELALIRERNRRVETDKAWETSRARKICLLVATYLITALVFYLIGVAGYALNALVPTAAFYLSTLSLPIARRIWLGFSYRNE